MDREQLIVRQACIKAAASAISAGTVGIPQDEIAARTVDIAEYFLEWVWDANAKPFEVAIQTVSNVVQAFPPQTPPQTSPQAPPPPSSGIPTVCPQCGCKVRDNRADNITRAQQGKILRPNFACNGKWRRQADGTFTQIQKECGWAVWPQTQNA